jgi:tRNA A-37 threonylcarbamoyl transferase component Bud32
MSQETPARRDAAVEAPTREALRVDIAGAVGRRRRRPSGEPPPLPRTLERTGRFWLAFSLVVIVAWALVLVIEPLGYEVTRVDLAILRGLERSRDPALTALARGTEFIGSDSVLRFVRWSALLILLFFRRFRHLFVFFGAILAVGGITTLAASYLARPRPLSIDILIGWEGPPHPSRPTAALAVTLIGISYSLVVAGRPRTYAKVATGVFLGLFALARLYLGVEHPTDAIVGIIIGVAVPLIAFRLLTPNEVFPVRYGRGRAAHLDVGGARGQAIRTALEEQLGLRVVEMKPFGLGGSGGSTPLRMRVEGEDGYLFAKLYARNHLRADRWYKLGRTLLYGRLEDEAAFQSVRRLVQYEDYLLRVMTDAGLNVPKTYGFVEITPEREYLLVTSFIEGSQELLDAPEINDAVIDSGLRLVRDLWDAGVAHRDIKPSNVLLRDNKVYLIDVAFGEVRPSPWRQAVDLANMMLVLAFRSSPERVYERACGIFTPEEIAEAFAATRSVTMPTQSRSLLRKSRGRMLARFRELAPHRSRLSIQRWTWRRIALTLGVLAGALLALNITIGSLGGFGLVSAPETPVIRTPTCEDLSGQLLLMAQSVPTASKIPCLTTLPIGWSYDSLRVRNGSSEFLLSYGNESPRSATISLHRHCDTSKADEIPSGEPGARHFQLIRSVGRDFASNSYYVFDGGCVVYRFNLFSSRGGSIANDAALALDFVERSSLAENLQEQTGFHL